MSSEDMMKSARLILLVVPSMGATTIWIRIPTSSSVPVSSVMIPRFL